MALLNQLVFGTPIRGFMDRNKSPVRVTPVKGPQNFRALIYNCPLNIDWDGSPTAYGLNRKDDGEHVFPLQKNLTPLESRRNGSLEDARANGDRHWVGVASMTEQQARQTLMVHYPGYRQMKPEVQHSIFIQFLDTRDSLQDIRGTYPLVQLAEFGGVAPGYYVSQCNARSGLTKDAWDQRSYIDASKVNYAALPLLPGVHLGDFGLIIRHTTGGSAGFFFGDTGAGNHLGECSGAVKLDIASEPNAEDEPFSFIVFPGSGGGDRNMSGLRMVPAVWSQIIKLKNTSNALAAYLAPTNLLRYQMVMGALFDWGGQEAKVPMRLGW